MARAGRQKSESGVYHILLRGVDKLFLNNEDYSEFLERLSRQFSDNDVRLLAFLLLPNRVQLLIDAGDKSPSLAVKPLCTGYARYFNRTYKADGRLFYDRFKSVPCETADEIADTAAFFHSVGKSFAREGLYSLGEYDNEPMICDCARLFELCGADAQIRKPHTLHLDDYDRLSREELEEYLKLCSGFDIETLGKQDIHSPEFERLFSGKGASVRKLLPLFGIRSAAPSAKKSVPKKTAEQPKQEKPTPAQNRNLSVWLL